LCLLSGREALTLAREGMDFADAFHLASSANCEAMMSFDTDSIKIAKREATLEVRRPV